MLFFLYRNETASKENKPGPKKNKSGARTNAKFEKLDKAKKGTPKIKKVRKPSSKAGNVAVSTTNTDSAIDSLLKGLGINSETGSSGRNITVTYNKTATQGSTRYVTFVIISLY